MAHQRRLQKTLSFTTDRNKKEVYKAEPRRRISKERTITRARVLVRRSCVG